MPYSLHKVATITIDNEDDSIPLYFPVNTFIDSFELQDEETKIKNYRVSIDTMSLMWYSFYLKTMKEPILYDQYLSKEIYRFSLFRSFDPPITITLEKQDDQFYLLTKMSNRLFRPPFVRTFQDGHEIKDTSSIFLQINEKQKIEPQQYDKFRGLLDETNFSCISPRGINEPAIDGAEWILEIHNKQGYHYVERNSPKDSTVLRKIGEFLIKLSPVKNEEIY